MPAFIIPAIIGAGASLGGAAIASHAAGKAAETQTKASDKALALNQQQYDQQREDLAPYRGLSAVLPSLMGRAGQPVTSTGWGQYQAPTTPPVGNAFGAMYQGGQPSGAPMATQGQPAMGARKTFPNGKVGIWDGRGWAEQ